MSERPSSDIDTSPLTLNFRLGETINGLTNFDGECLFRLDVGYGPLMYNDIARILYDYSLEDGVACEAIYEEGDRVVHVFGVKVTCDGFPHLRRTGKRVFQFGSGRLIEEYGSHCRWYVGGYGRHLLLPEIIESQYPSADGTLVRHRIVNEYDDNSMLASHLVLKNGVRSHLIRVGNSGAFGSVSWVERLRYVDGEWDSTLWEISSSRGLDVFKVDAAGNFNKTKSRLLSPLFFVGAYGEPVKGFAQQIFADTLKD